MNEFFGVSFFWVVLKFVDRFDKKKYDKMKMRFHTHIDMIYHLAKWMFFFSF